MSALFNFTKSIFISNVKRLNFPIKCSLALTYKCNLRCKMCNIWGKDDSMQELTVQEIGDFFKKAKNFYG